MKGQFQIVCPVYNTARVKPLSLFGFLPCLLWEIKLAPHFSGFSGFITWPLLQYHTDNWRTMSQTKRQWADNRRQAICLLTGKSMQIRGIMELSISNKEGLPDVSYPRTFRTQTIRTQSWDDSYPTLRWFVPKAWMIRTHAITKSLCCKQCVFIV